MDAQVIATVKDLDDKSKLLEGRVSELVKLTDGLKELVETHAKAAEDVDLKYEDQYKEIIENLHCFQVAQGNHFQEVGLNSQKQQKQIEHLEEEVDNLYKSLESVHTKQNCGMVGALLSVSLYLVMLTLGSYVFQQQVSK